MAKWGEGDPRWLVESREDGKNVNGWHWSEENKLAWSKQRLAELVPGAEAAEAGDAGWCARVTAVESVTGEAMLTTRKGNKRFAFYDLKLTLAWEAAPPSAAEPDAAAAAGGRAAAGAEATVAGVAAAEGVAGMSLGAAAGAEAAAGGDGSDAVAAPAAEASPAAASAAVVTGEMSIAELASGSDSDDLEVTISVSGGGSTAEQTRLKRHAQAALWPQVLQRLEQFVAELSKA